MLHPSDNPTPQFLKAETNIAGDGSEQSNNISLLKSITTLQRKKVTGPLRQSKDHDSQNMETQQSNEIQAEVNSGNHYFDHDALNGDT